MKAGRTNIVLLSVILVVTLAVSVNGSVWNGYYCQALPVSCETPKVILESGIAGTSTIYTNNTSAKVSVQAATDWLSGWDKRVKITINSTDIDETLTDFPVLVYLSSSSGENNDDVTSVFDEVGSDYNATAYTTSDGTTRLYFEVEYWNATSEKAWVWVKVPSISNTTDTNIYIYYDSSKDGSSYNSPTNVWDSNFKMIQHLHEISKTGGGYNDHLDSTSKDNDGEAENGVTMDAAGKINGADDFDGTNDYINVSDSNSLDVTEITISAWVDFAESCNGYILAKLEDLASASDEVSYFFSVSNVLGDKYLRLYVDTDGSWSADIEQSTETIPGNEWHHVVGTYSSDGTYKLYLDGSLMSSNGGGAQSGTIYQGSGRLLIGARMDTSVGNPQYYFNGTLDEIRISDTARSAAWIKADYESGRDNLLDFASEENWLDGWTKRIKITIDNGDIDSDLTDFPVLIHLSSSSGIYGDDVTSVFSEVGSNSKKIAVTQDDGTTQLYVEIEKWDDLNEVAWLWVSGSGWSISSTTDTDIYLYYDSTHADNTTYVGDLAARTEVWNSGFVAVYHVAEGSGTTVKSSTGSHNGTLQQSDNWVTDGVIGNCYDFDGADDYIIIANHADFNLSTYTIETWAKPNNPSNWDNLMYKGDPSTNKWQVAWTTNNRLACDYGTGGAWHTLYGPDNSLPSGSWTYCVQVMDNAENDHILYAGGSVVASNLNETGVPCNYSVNGNVSIAGIQDGTSLFPGYIDESRISNVARSAAWVKASYETQRDHLLDFGSEETSPLFEDGFETGDFTEWTETDAAAGCSITIVSSPKHHGSYAARAYTNASNKWAVARKDFGQLYDTLFARSYVQFAALPAADGDVFRAVYIMHVASSNPPSPWYYCLTAAGIKNVGGTSKWYLQLWNGTDFSELTADTPLPETNKWYSIEIKAVRSGTAGEARLWINGTQILSATDLDNDAWNTNSRVEVGLGGNPTNAPGTIYIDCVKVADTYIGPEDYDYVLKVVNQVGNNWTANLKVFESSNIGRLLSLNISLHDGTSSNQIAVNGGNIVNSEGPSYNLAGNATIYIAISNLQATTSETSNLYAYLKISVPGTSTCNLFVITFEIT